MNKPTIVFVYNADSGLFNTLTDIAHKVFSPKTYKCNLCALTHHPAGMRDEWKSFIEDLGYPLEFLHRDELEDRYGIKTAQLPAIFLERDGKLDPWIDAAAINATNSIDQLKNLVSDAASQLKDS